MVECGKEILVQRIALAIRSLLHIHLGLEPTPLLHRIRQLAKPVGQLNAARIKLEPFRKARVLRQRPRQRRLLRLDPCRKQLPGRFLRLRAMEVKPKSARAAQVQRQSDRAYTFLLVTDGLGWVQKEGSPVQEIRAGDVVWIAPGEKHWHGATLKTAMTHVAIAEVLDGKSATWMEKVDESKLG